MHLWWFICILYSVSMIYVEFGMCVNKLKIQYNSSEMDDSFVAFFLLLLVNSVVVFIHSVENWFYRMNHPNRKVLFLYSYTVYGICSLEYTATDERWEKWEKKQKRTQILHFDKDWTGWNKLFIYRSHYILSCYNKFVFIFAL